MDHLTEHVTEHDIDDDTEDTDAELAPVAPAADPDQVEVRRNVVLAAVLGAIAAVVALAYLLRAIGSGSPVDWVVCLAIGAIAVTQGLAMRDARTPLLVADHTGIRLRLGRSWQGLPWDELEEVEHAPRHTVLHDGRLVAFPLDTDAVLAELDPMARRQAAVSERVHGAPFAVPLGFTTRVVGADGDLTAALLRLAPDPELVVEVVPAESVAEEASDVTVPQAVAAESVPEKAVAEKTVVEEAVVEETGSVDLDDTAERPRPVVAATTTPSPLRASVAAIRSDVTSRIARVRPPADLPTDPQPDDTGVWRSETVVVPEMDVPIHTPVIGPQLAEARRALGLDVERFAQRTRIRPHVIEAIELDDFESCGGDFYARGHLRTLARVLGIDATPLLATYDETYADAPIDPRRVFESELATGTDGPIRSLRGGANWSVVVAAVMAVVLAWSVARLVVDRPADGPASDTPGLSAGSAGLSSNETTLAPAVPVVLTAEGGGAKVVVRDGSGGVVFKGNLAFGQSKTVKASPPVRVQTSDGSLTVGLDGAKATSMGRTGKSARNTFVPPTD